MTKFQKLQKLSSIIPFWSTAFVAIVTMFELKRRKASKKIWVYFILTFFLSGTTVYFLNAFIMTGQHILLNIIASGLILAVANILFVDFQVMSTQPHKRETNFNKRILIYCIILGAVIAGITMLLSVLLAPSVDIEDINGSENTSLAVIDTSEILSSMNNFSAFSSNMSKSGEHTGVTDKLKEYDYDEVTFRCKKISGVKTLQVTKATSDQLTLEINPQLEAGNMEIVIIVDGEYYDSVAANKISSVVLTGIMGKTVIVKMAAESAKVDVSISRQEDG